ncbi:MAG: hypothetical protein J6D03_05610 [Clostridia bacterium]|nr:hypothetical protein [Clostridia bacterium]
MKEWKNKSKNTNIESNIIVIILIGTIIVSSTIGLYAWAKYKSAINGTATAQVAKWNFNLKLKEGKEGAIETEGPIDIATTEYNHIANNTIAPGTKGEFEIILDTTGTEVSLVYEVKIDITNCPRNMSFKRKYVDDETGEVVTKVLSRGNGEIEGTERVLKISRYLPAKKTNYAGRSHTETIMWD